MAIQNFQPIWEPLDVARLDRAEHILVFFEKQKLRVDSIFSHKSKRKVMILMGVNMVIEIGRLICVNLRSREVEDKPLVGTKKFVTGET